MPERATREALEPLLAQRVQPREMAELLGVNVRSIYRALNRHGLRQPARSGPTFYTPAERDRVLALQKERLPMTWIAEDLQRPVVELRKAFPPGGTDPEWYSAWAQIRHNPTLLALHREFAPKNGRSA